MQFVLRVLVLAAGSGILGHLAILADDPPTTTTGDVNASVEAALQGAGDEATIRFPIGRTRQGTLIWCLAEPSVLDVRSDRQRRLLVGGLDGSSSSSASALAAFNQHVAAGDTSVAYACISIANPQGWARGDAGNSTDRHPLPSGFPPLGDAYSNPETIEAQFLWRFIGWLAPDVVEEFQADEAPEWQAFLTGEGEPQDAWPANSLAASLRQFPVAGIATTFSQRTVTHGTEDNNPSSHVAAMLARYKTAGAAPLGFADRSPLRLAMLRRVDRTPVQVAEQLSQHYGQHLKTVMYQPALALVARLKLGDLTVDESHRRDIEQIVKPYVDGSRPSLPEEVSGSHLAGHLIFAELAQLTGDPDYSRLVRQAADFGFHADGSLREAMPFHSEMSDAVFMACPILTSAARLTNDKRYLRMTHRHLTFMQQLCLRDDGLYRHSPLCEAAWGRGNGFPALGLALCLSDLDAMPAADPVVKLRAEMQASLERHLRALAGYQDVTGMWQQVIDDPGSYRELTSTCMITFAMVRGIRSGWLDEDEFGPLARQAWEAIKQRVGEDGVLLDVCTGTGKQKSLQDYRDRTAILGIDERGGAMALMAAVEMVAWLQEQTANPLPASAVE